VVQNEKKASKPPVEDVDIHRINRERLIGGEIRIMTSLTVEGHAALEREQAQNEAHAQVEAQASALAPTQAENQAVAGRTHNLMADDKNSESSLSDAMEGK